MSKLSSSSAPRVGQTIEIDYCPRDWAKKFHDSKERWKVLVCHRRAGKTVACLNHLQRDALRTPDSRFAYIAPFYKQAKNVAWDLLKHYAECVPDVKFNESELRVDYPNGARISLYGADNTDALRGLALWGVVYDEYSQQPARIHTEVVRPALSDHKGYAVWIGTPQGMNDFYRLYSEHLEDDNWYVELLKASDSGLIDSEELEDARREMSIDEYNQEFECSFTAAVKGAYYARQLETVRDNNQVIRVPYDPTVPVNTYWDLGISDTTCIVFAQMVNKEIHIIDFYEMNGQALEHYFKILDDKKYRYGTHWLPHDARARELGTGKSRYELFKSQLGADKVKIVPVLSVKDGIEATRVTLPRCWFDQEKTVSLMDALGSYSQEWDDKKGMFRDKPLHNWASHSCLHGDTIVATTKGHKQIKDIKAGEYIITPNGPAEVEAAGPVKQVKQLIEITLSNGSKLRATPEHKVFTERGLVTADALRHTDIVLDLNHKLCRQKSLYSMGENIGFRDAIIEQTTGGWGHVTCIERCGSFIMGLLPKGIVSIISTMTRTITPLRILSVSTGGSTLNIMPSTTNGLEVQRIKSSLLKPKNLQKSGTQAKRGLNGTASMAKRLGRPESGILKVVKSVIGSIVQRSRSDQNTAMQIVSSRLVDVEGGSQWVYDLTVKKQHCYVANGILVSNSDAMRMLGVALKEEKRAVHRPVTLNKYRSNKLGQLSYKLKL